VGTDGSQDPEVGLRAVATLLGLLVQGDNPAAAVLRGHGLDLENVRAEVDRLVAEGVLPRLQPTDAELLATLGVDLEAVYRSARQTFGDRAYYRAAERVRLRGGAAAHAGRRHAAGPPAAPTRSGCWSRRGA
jgi:hypothetical protein